MSEHEPMAFPSVVQYFPEDTSYHEKQGMTLRDYFSAHAIPLIREGLPPEYIAARCYEIADAMLAERAK